MTGGEEGEVKLTLDHEIFLVRINLIVHKGEIHE